MRKIDFVVQNCGLVIMTKMVPTWLQPHVLWRKKTINTEFSADGSAALAAADLDKNAIAFFSLGMADNQGSGKKMAPNLKIAL
jgi:hypothetical protein